MLNSERVIIFGKRPCKQAEKIDFLRHYLNEFIVKLSEIRKSTNKVMAVAKMLLAIAPFVASN